MSGPLSGLRVLDLSTVVSGPMATMLLADQGAEVIKLEAPGLGDLTRHVTSERGGMTALYLAVNRGKQALTLDLSGEEGLQVLRRLVLDCDVLVQNFRPGVVDRMGIGYAALRELKPDLVYLSISGFGFEGPLAGLPVYDNLIQASAGFAATQSDASDAPTLIRNLVCDKLTAFAAAQALCAALFARERGAGGQHVTLSMLDAAVAFLWTDAATDVALLEEDVVARETPLGNAGMTRFADGWGTASALSDEHFRGLCRVFGVPEVADDPRFGSLQDRSHHPDFRRVYREQVLPAAAALPVLETTERLQAEGIGAAAVVAPADLHRSPQVIANGTLFEREHPSAGRVREAHPAARFSATPAPPAGPAPLPGEHTDAVLARAGYGAPEIRRLRAAGIVS